MSSVWPAIHICLLVKTLKKLKRQHRRCKNYTITQSMVLQVPYPFHWKTLCPLITVCSHSFWSTFVVASKFVSITLILHFQGREVTTTSSFFFSVQPSARGVLQNGGWVLSHCSGSCWLWLCAQSINQSIIWHYHALGHAVRMWVSMQRATLHCLQDWCPSWIFLLGIGNRLASSLFPLSPKTPPPHAAIKCSVCPQ